jgi:hypothetical protein
VKIWQHLDPIPSICGGLTCKALYRVHRYYYPHSVPLNEGPERELRLSGLIYRHMEKGGYDFCGERRRYIKKQLEMVEV